MPVNVEHHMNELHALAHYFKEREDWTCASHVAGDEHCVPDGRLRIVGEVGCAAFYQLGRRLEAQPRRTR